MIKLSEFEKQILKAIAALGEVAHSVSIRDYLIGNFTYEQIDIVRLHKAITNLEEKGFIKSKLGFPTEARNGKRKRLLSIATKFQ